MVIRLLSVDNLGARLFSLDSVFGVNGCVIGILWCLNMSDINDMSSLDDDDASQLFITQSSNVSHVIPSQNEEESDDEGLLGLSQLNLRVISTNKTDFVPEYSDISEDENVFEATPQ